MEEPLELDSEEDDGAPGWVAIERALDEVYGDVVPRHFATVIKYSLGGPDPLDGINAYPNQDPAPHWHYVSFGLSELYEKQSEDPRVSGWGFELTFRLADDLRGEPPVWPCRLLQNLARYVFGQGAAFGKGHHVDAGGPIAADSETALSALAFVQDPLLPPIETPHGGLEFLQLVGLSADELQVVRAWSSERFLELLGEQAPLLITDLGRRSILGDPALREEVEEGLARDGSSQGEAFIEGFRWEREGAALKLVLPQVALGNLRNLLRGRTGHEREFVLLAPEQAARFVAGEPGFEVEEELLTISLTPAAARALADELSEGGCAVPGVQVVIEVGA